MRLSKSSNTSLNKSTKNLISSLVLISGIISTLASENVSGFGKNLTYDELFGVKSEEVAGNIVTTKGILAGGKTINGYGLFDINSKENLAAF